MSSANLPSYVFSAPLDRSDNPVGQVLEPVFVPRNVGNGNDGPPTHWFLHEDLNPVDPNWNLNVDLPSSEDVETMQLMLQVEMEIDPDVLEALMELGNPLAPIDTMRDTNEEPYECDFSLLLQEFGIVRPTPLRSNESSARLVRSQAMDSNGQPFRSVMFDDLIHN